MKTPKQLFVEAELKRLAVNQPKTPEQIAIEEAEARERMRKHDEFFGVVRGGAIKPKWQQPDEIDRDD